MVPQSDSGAAAHLTERIAALLSQRWEGKIRPMARDLGVPYATLNRVVHGQSPPAELLLALVQKANVDPTWLLSETVSGPTSGVRRGVPLVGGPLPFPPSRSPLFRTDRTVYPLPDLSKPGVYAFQVPTGHPVTNVHEYKVAGGDVLFIDTEWTTILNTGSWNDRLVVWRWADDQTRPGPPARPVVALGDLRLGSLKPLARVFGARIKKIPFDGDKPVSSEPDECPPRPAPGRALDYRHVAGVCVCLTRSPEDLFELFQRM